MRILFLMISYPNIDNNSSMYTDLTSEFLKNGHVVYVAAPGNQSTEVFIEGGITVLRINTLPLFNTSLLIKGLANLLLPYQYKRAITKYLSNVQFDLVVTPTPPITLIGTASYLKKKFNAGVYLILRDIFPQNAKDLGLINNRIIFDYFRKKEKKLYKLADSIGCMSQKNIDFIRVHNPEINQEKIHLLPNWVTVKESDDSVVINRSKFDFGDKFVAVFGGNFGIPQKVEFIIEVAEKLKENTNILFLLIGEGTEKNKITRLVLEKKLENVRIMEPLPRLEYLELLKACDIGLVNLSDRFTIPNIPSRTLSYWSLKIPVLAAVDKNTDYGELLERSNGGLWSLTGNINDYISNLMSLYNNPQRTKNLGLNGYNYLISELNTNNAYKTIISGIHIIKS
jgi:glycosyltransferase involved in cell wall biosynthesis